jgi:mycothiol synthase
MRMRRATSSDFKRIAAIRSACWQAYPQTGADLERNDAAFPKRQRFVLEQAGEVVAHGLIEPDGTDGALLEVDVQPELQSRGIGTSLFAGLEPHMQGFASVTTRVSESHAFALHFAQARGFNEERRSWHQVLHPQGFHASGFTGLKADLERRGYALHAYPEIADERKLYDLYIKTSGDVPGAATKRPSFDEYKIRVLEHPLTRLEAYFIAVRDGEWVAYTATRQRAADRPLEWHTGMTGVLRAHRGRGLALALKSRVIELAREFGILELHTNNDSTNAAMLSVNRRLGYERESGVIQMKLERT